MAVFRREHARRPIDIVGLGEMGIANSTSASAILSVATGISPAEATGRGTGVDDKGLDHKVKVIERAIRTPEGTTIWYLRVIHQIAQEAPVWTLDINGEEWGEVDFPEDVESAQALTARWDAKREAQAA